MRQTRLVPMRSAVHAVLAAALLFVTACVTKQEVEAIVGDSNRVLLEATSLAGDESVRADEEAEAVAQRIDAFVTAHPKEPKTTAPLRIRQAMLYAVRGKESLAAAAFQGIAHREDLTTERDTALYDVREFLPWWYRWAPVGTVDEAWRATAKRAMPAFDEVTTPMPPESPTRFLLMEMRAWTAWKFANSTSDPSGQQKELEAGVESFAGAFDEADRKLLVDAKAQGAGPSTEARLSRILRGRTVFAAFRNTSKELGDGVQRNWRPPWVASWFAQPQ